MASAGATLSDRHSALNGVLGSPRSRQYYLRFALIIAALFDAGVIAAAVMRRELVANSAAIASIPNHVAFTDRGQCIALMQHSESDFPRDESLTVEVGLDRNSPTTLIRTASPDPAYNCHGWVFTGGRFWIEGREVDSILRDNGYAPVDVPKMGDLVVYRDRNDQVLHSAVVRVADGDLLLIEGKWNNLGRYLHKPDEYPYSHVRAYYRSERTGHALRFSAD